MSVQVEKLEHYMAKLTITVPADRFDKAITEAYKKMKNQISIPGFRKGKVPQKMVEKMYGASMFYEEACNKLVPEVYNEEIAGITEIEITSQPNISLVQVEKGKDFIFEAEVATMPEAQLGEYKGLEVGVEKIVVTDEDVEKAIQKTIEKNAREISVEGPAQLEDSVVLDYEGKVDDVAFEGGSAEDYTLKLGSNSFIPGFEDQLVGAMAGSEVVVNVTFPEEYHAEDLAGKAAVFTCKIKEIKRKELPELNEEFVQDVSEFDTVEEYKEDVKKGLIEDEEKSKHAAKQTKVLDQIIENADFDIPEAMIDTEARRLADRTAQQMAQSGFTMEMYFQYTGQTMEDFINQAKPDAEKSIKQRLVLAAVAKAEAIEVSEEDITAEFQKMADAYSMEVDKLKELLGDDAAKMMTADIANQKALELVTDAAVEVEIEVPEVTVEEVTE